MTSMTGMTDERRCESLGDTTEWDGLLTRGDSRIVDLGWYGVGANCRCTRNREYRIGNSDYISVTYATTVLECLMG